MNKQEIWKKRISEYEASEQNLKEWCSENGIKFSTFYYWRRRVNDEKAGNFIKLQESETSDSFKRAPHSNNIELHINNAVIKINHQTDMKLLKEVVEVMNAQHR